MDGVDMKVKIEVRENSIQEVRDTLKLASYITDEVVIDASMTSEEKRREDVVYEVEVVTLRFKDGTVLRIDEEGEFVLSTENGNTILKGKTPSELFEQFRDVADAFFDFVEEKVNEFVNRVNIKVERVEE